MKLTLAQILFSDDVVKFESLAVNEKERNGQCQTAAGLFPAVSFKILLVESELVIPVWG